MDNLRKNDNTLIRNLYKELLLPNGLTLSMFDQTTRYYGDYHLVRLRIVSSIPITADLFTEEAGFQDARLLLGGEVVYSRIAEQMGVPSGETEQVLKRLAADLETNALPYLSSPLFPQKFILSQLKRVSKAPETGATGQSRFRP